MCPFAVIVVKSFGFKDYENLYSDRTLQRVGAQVISLSLTKHSILTMCGDAAKKRPERKAKTPEMPLPDEELIKAVSRLMQQKRNSLARLQQNVVSETHLSTHT